MRHCQLLQVICVRDMDRSARGWAPSQVAASRLVCGMLFTLLLPVATLATTSTLDTFSLDTAFGTVNGLVTKSSVQFLGVPFAEPPVGSLRWVAPRQVSPWTAAYDATQSKGGCMQQCGLPSFLCPPTVSEDCLYLNIFAPLSITNASQPLSTLKMPVYVYIHGGGFSDGYAGSQLYAGDYFAQTQNMITVFVQYRLGSLGFLATGDAIAGNFALQDQLLALQWIRRTIAAFGGDADNIILAGESAGAMSVAIHLTNVPVSSELGISRAVMESNPAGIMYQGFDGAVALGKKFAENLGCAPDDLPCLQAVPAERIVSLQENTSVRPSIFHFSDDFALTFAPVIDGKFVLGQPVNLFEQGHFLPVPVLMGSNGAEGLMFVFALNSTMPDLEYDAAIDVIFGRHAPAVLKHYPACKANFFREDCRAALSVLVTDAVFGCASRHIALHIARAGVPVYYYFFNHVLSFGASAWGPDYWYCIGQVCHGSELPFVFNVNGAYSFMFSPEEVQLADHMGTYWSNFAASPAHAPSPNTGRAVPVEWPMFDANSLLELGFQTADPSILRGFQAGTCSFWDSLGYDI